MILLIPNRLWHPDQYWSERHSLLVDESNGMIKALLRKDAEPVTETRLIKGSLIPGFVNAHCHLELSHLFRKIPTRTGMRSFVQAVNQLRNQTTLEAEQHAIQEADKRMWEEGIVAVGDISNDQRSLVTKKHSKIYYHTFLEVFGWNTSRATQMLEQAKESVELFHSFGSASIVPHAPYSVPPSLFNSIRAIDQGLKTWTIHHAESDAEVELFATLTGDLANFLQSIGVVLHPSIFENHTSPTSYTLSQWPIDRRSIWVHNTRMTAADFKLADQVLKRNLFLCTCPNANLYIEDKLPDYNMWLRNGAQVCIGTDSLASNHSLSVWDEVKTLLNETDLNLETILPWTNINGARALGIENKFGTLEAGKAPGIICVDDLQNIQRLF